MFRQLTMRQSFANRHHGKARAPKSDATLISPLLLVMANKGAVWLEAQLL